MAAVQRQKAAVRVIAGGAVVVAHAYVVFALLAHRAPAITGRWDETDLFVLIDLEPTDLPAPSKSFDPAAPQPDTAIPLEPSSIDPPLDEPSANASGPPIDWLGAAERAAAGVATEPAFAPRELGALTHAEPKPRAAKPFAWDRSQTERVTTVPGGIRLRMGSHCEVVFAPWPVGGCSLGKIPARGDLFSEMSAPAELGDLHDDSRAVNRR